jgi:hypothetical protein
VNPSAIVEVTGVTVLERIIGKLAVLENWTLMFPVALDGFTFRATLIDAN